jgi:hypothetical protein
MARQSALLLHGSPGFDRTVVHQSLADKAAEQEFYNSKLGIPHVVDGARVTDKHISILPGRLRNGRRPSAWSRWVWTSEAGSTTRSTSGSSRAGIPGTDLNIMSQCQVLKYGKCRDFEELDELMREWGVNYCVIDAQPERRKALEFANRWYGIVRVCWYPNGISGKMLHLNDEELSVSVDRTSWLDLSLGRLRRGKPHMHLPTTWITSIGRI